MDLDDTIVAVSSPRGSGPRGIVRLSGPMAVEITERLFRADSAERLQDISGNSYVPGRIGVEGASLPAAVYLFRAPRSYTRQDIVELHLLGAPGVLALVMEACLAAGARRAEPGEFTARAFLAGAFDLSQVHGIAGMIAARSDHQLRAAERLLHGALSRTAEAAREELADLLALVEAALDFADEPIEFIGAGELRRRLDIVRQALWNTSAAGLRAERWNRLPSVVLAGEPNVGKSSLLNRLTGMDRAICGPVSGTTRDVLTAPLELGEALECLLVDAAGLTCGQDLGPVDARAQAAIRQALRDADLILHVVEPSGRSAGAAPGEAFDGLGAPPRIVVLNKCDLLPADKQQRMAAELRQSTGRTVCPISATTGQGCDLLKREIGRALGDRPVDTQDASLALMAEHREALDQALEAIDRAVKLASAYDQELANAELVAAEMHNAAEALGVLIGCEDTEQLLGRVFSRFCVGK
jgi:tRNA modification GTPase